MGGILQRKNLKAIALKKDVLGTSFLIFLLVSLFLLFFSNYCYAECLYIQAGLKNKMKSYQEFRELNQRNLENLIKTDTHCKKTGNEITTKVATLSAAQSCEALKDISGMDKSMHDVGEECSDHFKKIETVQIAMHKAFDEAQDDLQGAMKIMEESAILQKYCGDEIQATVSMVKGFLKLEGSIVAIENVSDDGRTNYTKMKEAAGALQNMTNLSGTNCGAIATSLSSAVAGISKPVDAKVSAAASGMTLSKSGVTGEEARRAGKKGSAERGLASGSSEISADLSGSASKNSGANGSKVSMDQEKGKIHSGSEISSGVPAASGGPSGSNLFGAGSILKVSGRNLASGDFGKDGKSANSPEGKPKEMSNKQSSIAFAIHAIDKELKNSPKVASDPETQKANESGAAVASMENPGSSSAIRETTEGKPSSLASDKQGGTSAREIASSNADIFELIHLAIARIKIEKNHP